MNEPEKTKETEKLIIFHFDMNFVNLREDYIRKWLKKVADMGYNAILWEIEDKVQLETCPECIWPEAMSKQTFRDILEYAESLGLEAIPLLQTIGHGEYIMMHKEYSHLQESPERYDCYCTLNPDVRTFIKSMITEYLELFGNSRFFHLGGDEAYIFASCPECARFSEEHSKNQLYGEYILDISQELFKHNIRPGVWCDMILHYPDDAAIISDSFVIWDWDYHSNDNTTDYARVWGKPELVNKENIDSETIEAIPELIDVNGDFVPFYTSDFLQRLGFDVILCSASRSGGDSPFCPDFKLHAMNIIGATRKTIHANLLGTCVTSWGIRINNLETQELLLRLAPKTLEAPNKSAGEILKETADIMFDCDSCPLIEALYKIGVRRSLFQQYTSAVQWNLNLKDSLPAPTNFIADKMNALQSENPGNKSWSEIQENHADIFARLVQGIELLNKFSAQSQTSFEFLEAWSKAAYHQFWLGELERIIMNESRGEQSLALALTLKEETQKYFKRMETPESARKNAGLIYDCIIEYLQTD